MFSSFDDIGRMDERAKFCTPGADRVRSGRERFPQEESGALIFELRIERDDARFYAHPVPDKPGVFVARHGRSVFQRAGDEVI